MHCPLCRAARVVAITMNVNERQLTLRSCSGCEVKWWESDGRNVGLPTVLNHARTRRHAHAAV